MKIDSILGRLNPKQLEAVEYIDGPLLVLAGPGTGKTQLLSSRVANILQKTDTPPENIVCLTFTNNAANNLYMRLQKLIGGASRQIKVRTFHSLAAEIIADNSDFFWNGARMQVLPDILQTRYIREILASLPVSSPLASQFAGEFTASGDVLRGIKLAKEAGLSPDKLNALINTNLRYIDLIENQLVDALLLRINQKNVSLITKVVNSLPQQQIEKFAAPFIGLDSVLKNTLNEAMVESEKSGKFTAISRWKSRWLSTQDSKPGLHKERSRNLWWLELAEVYSIYRQRLHLNGYYDYADMLVESISVLEQNLNFLAAQQEQCHYLLIDEFQDSNAAQLRLAALLSASSIQNGSPNIMAVGDDDQTIFKFNGAEHSNVMAFEKIYPKSKIIILDTCYRSHQEIIDTAELVIDQAHSRLSRILPDLSKKVTSQVAKSTDSIIERKLFSVAQDQYKEMAEIASNWYKKGQSVAILARSHQSLENFVPFIVDQKVPIGYERLSDIRQQKITKQIKNICAIVVGIQNQRTHDVQLGVSEMLLWPELGLSPEQIWKIATNRNYDWPTRLHKSNINELKKLHKWLFEIASISSTETLAVSFEYLLGLKMIDGYGGPLAKNWISKTIATNLEISSTIQTLRTLTSDLSNNQNSTLEDLHYILDTSLGGSQPIGAERYIGHRENSVQLMTVHKSKGLEFDNVILLDVIEREWSPKRQGRKAPANLPLQRAGDDQDDFIRLLFVAISRAKQSIIVSRYKFDDLGQEVLGSSILTNILPEREINNKLSSIAKAQITGLHWPLPKLEKDKKQLTNLLNDYQMSVTHLINYLDVSQGGPKYFYETNLLRIPQAKTSSLAFGTAIHSALETAQSLINKDKFSLKKVSQQFIYALIRQNLTKIEYEKQLNHGLELLKILITKNDLGLIPGSFPEYKMKDIVVGRATIRGTLDLIQIVNNSTIKIIDYKTGKPIKKFSYTNKQTALKAWKHRLQLIFYALLVQNSRTRFVNNQLQTAMVYLEEPNLVLRQLEYIPTPDEMSEISQLINVVYGKIMNLDFPDTSGYSADYTGVQSFISDLLKK
ncbi:MAG: ATP-dependent DNA helicase [Patescibacteria group bacterium]